MTFSYPPKRKNPKVKRSGTKGFPDGLNTLAHPFALKETELQEVINAIYSQYGTLSKRPGTLIIGEALENSTKTINLEDIYNINGNSYLIRLSDVGKPEYYNFDTLTWILLTGTAPEGYSGDNPAFTSGTPTFNTTVVTNIVQAGGYVFFANSVNELVYWDGTQWYIFDELANPSTIPTVAKTGSGTGSAKHYYRYVWYNSSGGTLASPVVDAEGQGTGWYGGMPDKLDSSTYLTVTVPEAPEGAVSVGIFKGYTPGDESYLDKIEANQTTYADKGEKVPSEIFGVPKFNETTGPHFKLLDVYRSTLVGITVEQGDDTVVYSAGLDKLTSFGLPDGGGYYTWGNGDGENINAIKSFAASNKDSFFVFKNSKTGKFVFETDGATVTTINVNMGSVAPFSPHAAGNNLRLYSRDGVASLGNEANYGTILRFSVLSIKADTITKQVTAANLSKVCSGYFNHLSMFGIPLGTTEVGNNAVLVFDERYNAWALWTGITPAVFAKFIGPDNVERMYYGDVLTGNVLEMFNGKTDKRTSTGSGTPITMSLTPKQFDMDYPDRFKKYKKVVLIFGALTGSNTTVQITEFGQNGVLVNERLRITEAIQKYGFGTDFWGITVPGTTGGSTVPIPGLNIKFINLKNRNLFAASLNLQNDGVSDEIEFIGLFIYYSDSNKPLPFRAKITQIA